MLLSNPKIFKIMSARKDYLSRFTNVFTYAAGCQNSFENQMREIGQEPISTFFSDLSIAEWIGDESVVDTIKRAKDSWKADYKMLTELIIATNWKSWQWARVDKKLCSLYVEQYELLDRFFYELYKHDKEAADYYFRMTD